jgi:hypothetical protein
LFARSHTRFFPAPQLLSLSIFLEMSLTHSLGKLNHSFINQTEVWGVSVPLAFLGQQRAINQRLKHKHKKHGKSQSVAAAISAKINGSTWGVK